MTFWQLFPSPKRPLNDRRDLMARLRLRFLWCTLPYFAIALIMAAYGETTLLFSKLAAIPLIVLIGGGILDWCRLRLRAAPPVAA